MKGPVSVSLRGAAVVQATGIERRDVHVAGGRIASNACRDALTIDADGLYVFPGLINAHDHLHLNCLPTLADLGTFPNAYEWMDAAQARRATAQMTAAEQLPLDVRLWHGGLKNLLAGVTTVVHHDPWKPPFADARFPVRVPDGYGWCHSLGLAGVSSASALRYGPSLRGRGVSATRWFIHLGEGIDALAAGELALLDRLGALDGRTVLVHATALAPRDIDRVIDAGAWTVWCPASNRNLFGHTLDPVPLARRGRIALGTDSRLSGSSDLLDELRVAAAAARLSHDDLLRLVTTDAARVIARPDLGRIAPGARADLIAIEGGGQDPFDALLGGGRAGLALVVRDGQPLLGADRFRPWHEATGEDLASIAVDGCVRQCPRWLLGPPGTVALEPGLEVLA